MSTRNTYPLKVRRQVDRALSKNTAPGAIAKKLGLPRTYVASRKQALRNRAAVAALKAQEQAAPQQGAANE